MFYTPQQRALANEIATKLNDQKSLSQFLRFTEEYSEELLRELLDHVITLPDSKVRTSRARLFTHLVKSHAQY